MLEIVRVSELDDDLHHEISKLLYECGQHMYNNSGLTHWLRPYPQDRIREDCLAKSVYVVRDAEQVIATFTLSERASVYFLDGARYLYWSKLGVLPSFEGRGIGGKCVEFIEKLAGENGFLGIRLEVYSKSEHAVSYFKRYGFNALFEARTVNYPITCMEKRLQLK